MGPTLWGPPFGAPSFGPPLPPSHFGATLIRVRSTSANFDFGQLLDVEFSEKKERKIEKEDKKGKETVGVEQPILSVFV